MSLVTRENYLAQEWQIDKLKLRCSTPGFQEANEYLNSLAVRLPVAYWQMRTSGLSLRRTT